MIDIAFNKFAETEIRNCGEEVVDHGTQVTAISA